MRVRDRAMMQDRSLVHTEHPLGENQSFTREGFLLCRNVPIARTGTQEYLNDEICDDDDVDNELYKARGKNGIVLVDRPDEEVFRPETMASFEGKDVVDDHPEGPVEPSNYEALTVGVTLNPRRGEGALADYIVADLLIKKASAIAAVRAGKREVSCGYDADYKVLGPGRAQQHNIIGNHVALVDRGRCGFMCAIRDKDPNMKTKDKNEVVRDAAAKGLLRRMLDAIRSKDRKALEKAMDEMENEEDEASEKETMEATGTHIHLHLGGEEEASGADPDKAGAAKDEGEEEEKDPAKTAAANMDKRLMGLESGMQQLADAVRKLAMRGGEDAEEEGEEEAEGDDPEEDEAEVQKEPEEDEEAEEDPKAKGKDKGKDKAKDKGKDKAKDKTKDAAVKDSVHLKDEFTEAKSGAEVLAPGLKMPTFDSKAAATLTKDSICLLKRRALAQATRDEKNGGKDAVATMLGRKTLAGLDCGSVDSVFNGAVALMQDRNMQDDPKTISEARGRRTKDEGAKAPKSIGELNQAMRTHYKQPSLK